MENENYATLTLRDFLRQCEGKGVDIIIQRTVDELRVRAAPARKKI